MKDFNHDFFDEIYFFNTLESSSKKAVSMIKNRMVNGNFLVLTHKQSGGIGRDKNAWYSPYGGIWFTMGLNGFLFETTLTLFAGITLHKTICLLFPQLAKNLYLKWPNDLYYKDKKIAGILTNHFSFYGYYIIGVGLDSNVDIFPDHLENTASSLKVILGKEVENEKIVDTFFDIFMKDLPDYLENNFDVKYFNNVSLLKEKKVVIDTNFEVFEGTSLGVNKKGALIIKFNSGIIQPFYSGSIVNFK